MQLALNVRRLEDHIWGAVKTDSLVLNLKLLPQSVAWTNPIRNEPTGGVQMSLHVRACIHAHRQVFPR